MAKRQSIKATYKLKEVQTMPVYDIKGLSVGDLQQIRRTLAKAVNQRLVRLENTKSKVTGRSLSEINEGAYAQAQSILDAKGRNRFSEVLKVREYDERFGAMRQLDKRELKREITQLQDILAMKSSRAGNVLKFEENRVKFFESYGFSEEVARSPQFYEFLRSNTYKELKKMYDSEQIFDFFAKDEVRPETIENIQKAWQEYIEADSEQEKTFKGLVRAFNGVILK